MKKKTSFFILAIVAAFGAYFGQAYEKSHNLEEYFIERFAEDWLLQITRHEPHQHGEVFEKAYEDMKRMGYNPQQIRETMIKGFDRGHEILAQQEKPSVEHPVS